MSSYETALILQTDLIGQSDIKILNLSDIRVEVFKNGPSTEAVVQRKTPVSESLLK